MSPSDPIADWLVRTGIELESHDDLVEGLATRLTAAGVPIERLMVGADALHPTQGGRSIRWMRGRGLGASGFTREQSMGSHFSDWLQSPLHPLITQRLGELRRRLTLDYRDGEFPLLDRLKREGMTDYLALAVEYPPRATLGEVEGMVATFATAAPGGFAPEHVAVIRRLVRPLALAYKAVLLLETARTLTRTYLGADAAARVLAGRIARGEAETIRAVIWYSDLEGFTRLADARPKERLMALLNDYAGLVLDTVAARGGQVLKLSGDGVLAIFDLDAAGTACRRVLGAAVAVENAAAELGARLRRRGLSPPALRARSRSATRPATAPGSGRAGGGRTCRSSTPPVSA